MISHLGPGTLSQKGRWHKKRTKARTGAPKMEVAVKIIKTRCPSKKRNALIKGTFFSFFFLYLFGCVPIHFSYYVIIGLNGPTLQETVRVYRCSGHRWRKVFVLRRDAPPVVTQEYFRRKIKIIAVGASYK